MTDRTTDPYADELEKRQALEQWEARKKAEAEAKDRQQKQATLEHYLQERAGTHLDHTGTPPTTATLERWREEYVDEQARQREAEKQAKLDAAANQDHYPGI